MKSETLEELVFPRSTHLYYIRIMPRIHNFVSAAEAVCPAGKCITFTKNSQMGSESLPWECAEKCNCNKNPGAYPNNKINPVSSKSQTQVQ